MAYQHKPNSGTLFQRDTNGNDKAPTDTGDAMLTCPHCNQSIFSRIAGWFKQEQGKSNRISLKLTNFKTLDELEADRKSKSAQPQQRQAATTRPDGGINPPNDPAGDDVPF